MSKDEKSILSSNKIIYTHKASQVSSTSW